MVVSTNGRGLSCSASTWTVPTEIDFDQLSTRGLAILRQIATPIVNGYSVTEIARATGTTRSWVLTRLDELREEINRLN
jgi:hypothetical protein